MEVDFDSCRTGRARDSAWKTDSLRPPIEIGENRVLAIVEAEIVVSRNGMRHKSAGEIGKMNHRFIHRVNFYVQAAWPPITHLLTHRRLHGASGRNQLFGPHGGGNDPRRPSTVPSRLCAQATPALERVQWLRDLRRASELRGIVMKTTPSSNGDAVCAIARILARQAVREHLNRGLLASQSERDTNIARSSFSATPNS